MPSYKGTRVHSVSLLAIGAVPGTESTSCRWGMHPQSQNTHTFQPSRFLFASGSPKRCHPMPTG